MTEAANARPALPAAAAFRHGIRGWLLHALFGAIAAVAAVAARPAVAAEIWLGGVDPFVRQIMQPGAPSDYTDLFRPDAPWSKAAAHVSAFKASTQFIERASDDQLRQMFADLRRRHIKLALAALMQPKPPNCGANVESYTAVGEMPKVAKRIEQLGGTLSYIVMDEPLWYGHIYDGPQACHDSIEAIARGLADNVAAFRKSFPDVEVGDVEPLSVVEQPPDWLSEIAEWITSFRRETGQNLAFFDTDIDWHGPWKQQLSLLVPWLHAAAMKVGIIYDGDGNEPDGVDWTRHAEERFSAVEAIPALIPDQAILQSWNMHPEHMLPETESGTMTWLVNRYVASETRITLQRSGNRLSGQLATAEGKPIAGQALRILGVDVHNAGLPADLAKSGVVPNGAKLALFALRANTECNCSGPVDVTIGPMTYRDNRTGQEVRRTLSVGGDKAAPGGVRITAAPGQPIAPNTATWPVTPGDLWTVHVTMGATEDSSGSGYVGLFFMGVERLNLRFAPAARPIGTVTTDADGRFAFVAGEDMIRIGAGYRAEYAGSEAYRLSSAFVH